jgi:putative PIN family toxin of toxin-antitoxin system
MRRIVVDTNVFVSALIGSSQALRVLRSVERNQSLLLISPALLAEIEQVLSRPKFAPYFQKRLVDPQRLLLDYARIAQLIVPASIDFPYLRDPKDLMVIECALSGQADFIVTGDQDLLVLGSVGLLQIVTPADFLTILDET